MLQHLPLNAGSGRVIQRRVLATRELPHSGTSGRVDKSQVVPSICAETSR
jgi:hypothetical protein